ncbi:MAG: hypothetical protein E7047_07480 [Lentisphaerae bacterium]|nr:hypothetical protein [Lentisphaerota bacterium]
MNIDHLTNTPEMPDGLSMLRRIGSGGAGNIFMVQDITGKNLALKVIKPQWQSSELQSVKLLRELPSHPAVTQIYQTGQLTDGKFFYTMELADNAGRSPQYIPDTLAQRIASGNLATMEILSVIRTVTAGVMHLHEHKLFHGDIKPENIIFINGQAKLSDFGTLAGSGSAGTAGFIPDDPGDGIDRDCYALAKTLYCAYSRRDAADFPSPPDEFAAEDFKIIRQLYMKGCAGQAGKRFASAADWQNALDHALEQISHPDKSGKRRKIKAAIAAGGVLVLSGIVFSVLPAGRKSGTPAALPPAPETSVTPSAAEKVATPTSSGKNEAENKIYTPPVSVFPPSASKPESLPPVNYTQYVYAKSIIDDSMYFHDGFAPDFRQKFEAVSREMPDKLDPEFCRKIKQYHADLDRFLQLRRELSAPDITPDELIRRFTQSDYHAFYNSLRNQSNRLQISISIKWRAQYILVRQLYDTLEPPKRPAGPSNKE